MPVCETLQKKIRETVRSLKAEGAPSFIISDTTDEMQSGDALQVLRKGRLGMKSVYKYKIHPADKSITLPGKAEILSTIVQGGEIVIYALVDPDDKTIKEVDFMVLGTENIYPDERLDDFAHLGTVCMGPYVWHIFIKDVSAKE